VTLNFQVSSLILLTRVLEVPVRVLSRAPAFFTEVFRGFPQISHFTVHNLNVAVEKGTG